MTFPNSSSCDVCLKTYLHGAGSQGDVTRVVAVNPWVLLGIYPILPWEKRQIQLPCKLVSKVTHWCQSLLIGLKTGLMPSCVHALETAYVQHGSVCVCVTQLNSHLKVTVKWGMGEVVCNMGRADGRYCALLQRREVPQTPTQTFLLWLSLYVLLKCKFKELSTALCFFSRFHWEFHVVVIALSILISLTKYTGFQAP